jgi:hypothetical protein
MHDSIEDARSSLKLYKAYHEFEEQGVFDQKLEELYRLGKDFVCDYRQYFLYMAHCTTAMETPCLSPARQSNPSTFCTTVWNGIQQSFADWIYSRSREHDLSIQSSFFSYSVFLPATH